MIDLPPARRIRAVCIAREGGFAWTPGLSRPRSVGLDGDGGATRQRLMQMLREAAERGCESGPGVQGADRRRYRVEIFIDEDDNDGDDVGAGGAAMARSRLWSSRCPRSRRLNRCSGCGRRLDEFRRNRSQGSAQCAIQTGTEARSSTVRVAPPSMSSRAGLWP